MGDRIEGPARATARGEGQGCPPVGYSKGAHNAESSLQRPTTQEVHARENRFSAEPREGIRQAKHRDMSAAQAPHDSAPPDHATTPLLDGSRPNPPGHQRQASAIQPSTSALLRRFPALEGLRRRPLVVSVMCLILGIAASYHAGGRAWLWFLGAAVCGGVGLLLWCIRKHQWIRHAALLFAFFTLGGALTIKSLTPPVVLASQTGRLTGSVASQVKVAEKGREIILKDAVLHTDTHTYALGRVRIFLFSFSQTPKYGEQVDIKEASLAMTARQSVPGAYNERLSQAARGIFYAATANAEDAAFTGPEKLDANGVFLKLNAASVAIVERLFPNNAQIARAMLLGEEREMPEDLLEAFRATGMGHLLALSGLNVGALAGSLMFVLLRLRLGRSARIWLLLLFLAGFVLLTGAGITVVRAGIMCFFAFVLPLGGRRIDAPTTLFATAGLVLIASPLQLFEVGFQLSFGAVLGIICLMRPLERLMKGWPRWLSGTIALSFAAQIGVFPLSLYYFARFSLIGLPLNLIMTPLFSGLVCLLMAVFVLSFPLPALAVFLGGVLDAGMTILCDIVLWGGSLPKAYAWMGSPGIAFCIVALVGVVMVSDFVKTAVPRAVRLTALTLALTLCLAIPRITQPDALAFTALDARQADATIIQTPSGKTYLVDVGLPSTPADQYLLFQGLRIDGIFLSHLHEDHMGGIAELVERLDIPEVFIPFGALDYAEESALDAFARLEKSTRITGLRLGDVVALDRTTTLHVLWPVRAYADANASSLIARVSSPHGSILLTGDATPIIEVAVDFEKTDILKVAHHGSNSVTSERFLEAVSPRAAVICVGKNTYGHPTPGVLSRLAAANVPIYRTDIDGTLTLSLQNGTLSTSAWKTRAFARALAWQEGV